MHGKNIIITGASKGIGKAIALTLASEGFNIAICSRKLEEAKEVTDFLEEKYHLYNRKDWWAIRLLSTLPP